MKSHRAVLVDDKTYNVVTVRNGGMGRVWLLEQAFEDTYNPIYRPQIAVKTFDFMDDQASVERELNIWISLEHPSLLPLSKIGRLNYRLAAIMPRLPGSLDDLIEERGALGEGDVIKIVTEVVAGLSYAWTTFNLVHLDLKPSNVLVESAELLRTKIADWGISRLGTDVRNNSPMQSVYEVNDRTAYGAGTPLYMAPERFTGSWVLSPVVDIYSLGMMAVQLRTGILPFRLDQYEPTEEIATGSYFNNAERMLDDCSDGFRDFCLHCLDPDPSTRVSNFRAVKLLLDSARE